MLDQANGSVSGEKPVVVKKYANRRLYNTETSTYVTLDDLGKMVRAHRDFVVYDAKTGDDLTHSVLTQIIVEQESRGSGPNLLPAPFLRQLIRFYDDTGVSKMVPSYLQMSLEALAREQERLRAQFTQGFGQATLDAYQEQVTKNMALFEQAMRMWTPMGVGGATSTSSSTPDAHNGGTEPSAAQSSAAAEPETSRPSAQPEHSASNDLDDLRGQLAEMQRKIEALAGHQS